jgi:hypothetical protein
MSLGENGKPNGSHGWDIPRTAKRFSSLRELSVSYEGHSEDIVTRPPDISARGMFINTTRTFPEGAVLNVKFRLAISGYEVRSRAEVRYCLPGVGVGVEFIDISRECVRAIEREIEVRSESLRK